MLKVFYVPHQEQRETGTISRATGNISTFPSSHNVFSFFFCCALTLKSFLSERLFFCCALYINFNVFSFVVLLNIYSFQNGAHTKITTLRFRIAEKQRSMRKNCARHTSVSARSISARICAKSICDTYEAACPRNSLRTFPFS